ncbi:hypothetical protein MHU86_19700 [Fragilaria crotonensis]|nr:hypothetical protein MHU86_19700 [Fragilaria crotonensis]
MDRENPAKHVYGSFFAAKTSVVAYGARMAFVRESLRRVRAKQDRRRDRRRTATGESVGKALTCVGEGGVGLGNVLGAPIPKKNKQDDVAMDRCSEDERSVDGEESWSDYTYASGGSDSTGGKDGGLILERDPFVERVENDLKETKAGDVVAIGGELAPPVEQGTGPLTYCFSREVPVPGSCNRAPIDLVECDDGIRGYVDCVARCPGDVVSRDTGTIFEENSDRRGKIRSREHHSSSGVAAGFIGGCDDYVDGERQTSGWESLRRCRNLRSWEFEVCGTRNAPREHRYGGRHPDRSGREGEPGYGGKGSSDNHRSLCRSRDPGSSDNHWSLCHSRDPGSWHGERKRPRSGVWCDIEGDGMQCALGREGGAPDWEPREHGRHWEHRRGGDIIDTRRDCCFGTPKRESHRQEGHGSNQGHRGSDRLGVPRGDRWDGVPPGTTHRGDSSCRVSRAARGWCRTWNGVPEVDRQPGVFGSEHTQKMQR